MPSLFEFVTKEQKWLIASTFVIGAIAGAYLYLTVFATQFQDGILPDLPETVSAGDVSVRGGQYGGCINSGLTCPSFEIDADGVLSSSPSAPLTDDPVVIKVDLDRETLALLRELITTAPLAEYAELSSRADCQAAANDEYRYVLFVGENSYIVDTCRTNFSADSDLAIFLQGFFERE